MKRAARARNGGERTIGHLSTRDLPRLHSGGVPYRTAACWAAAPTALLHTRAAASPIGSAVTNEPGGSARRNTALPAGAEATSAPLGAKEHDGVHNTGRNHINTFKNITIKNSPWDYNNFAFSHVSRLKCLPNFCSVQSSCFVWSSFLRGCCDFIWSCYNHRNVICK